MAISDEAKGRIAVIGASSISYRDDTAVHEAGHCVAMWWMTKGFATKSILVSSRGNGNHTYNHYGAEFKEGAKFVSVLGGHVADVMFRTDPSYSFWSHGDIKKMCDIGKGSFSNDKLNKLESKMDADDLEFVERVLKTWRNARPTTQTLRFWNGMDNDELFSRSVRAGIFLCYRLFQQKASLNFFSTFSKAADSKQRFSRKVVAQMMYESGLMKQVEFQAVR